MYLRQNFNKILGPAHYFMASSLSRTLVLLNIAKQIINRLSKQFLP